MIRTWKRALVLFVVLAGAGATTAAACPSCFSALEEERWAYWGTTAFMTLMPLVLIAGLAWGYRRLSARAEREREQR